MLSGLVRLQVGQVAVAERAFARYSAAEPDDSRGPTMLAIVHMRRDNNQAAIEVTETFLKRKPDDVGALRLLASAQLRSGAHEKAAATLERVTALQKDGSDAAARQARAALALLGQASAADMAALGASDIVPGDGLSKAILLANDHMALGEAAEAKTILPEPLQTHPGNPILRALAARIEIILGDSQAGRAHYEHALKSAPDFTPALVRLIFQDLIDGNTDAATTRVRAAASRAATPLSLVVQFTDALANAGQVGEAESLLRDRLRQQPDNLGLLDRILIAQFRLPERPGALESARAMIGKAKDDAPVLARGASALFELGEKVEAKAAFRKAIALAPTNDAVRLTFATYLAADKDYGEARKQLNEILKIKPDHRNAALRLIDIHLVEKNVEEARALLKRLPADPVSSAVLKAYLEARTDQLPAALETLEAAIRLNPVPVPVPVPVLNQFSFRIAAGDPAGAVAGATAWLQKRPDDNAVRVLMANQLLAQNDISAAIGEFEVVLAKEPRNPAVLNNVAWLKRDSDRDSALAYARRALTLAPSSPEIQDTYGYLLMRAGKVREALRLFKVAASNSGNPEIHTHYAMALKEQGDRQEALAVLDRVLQSKSLTETQRADAEKLRSSMGN